MPQDYICNKINLLIPSPDTKQHLEYQVNDKEKEKFEIVKKALLQNRPPEKTIPGHNLSIISNQSPLPLYTMDQEGNYTISAGALCSFHQKNIISKIDEEMPIHDFILRFNGLCELICNKVLIDNLLEGEKGDISNNLAQLNLASLEEEQIIKSHMVDVYNVFYKMLAFLFNIYPDNIFDITDQWKLVNDEKKINEEILFKGLDSLTNGDTLKFEVFSKESLSFSGHSLLIKKLDSDRFIFFDPNTGASFLNKKELIEKMNEQMEVHNGTDILLSRGELFKKRLIDKKILKIAEQQGIASHT